MQKGGGLILSGEEIVINGRKTEVFHWPVENSKAKVIIVHGLGEHVARYDVISKEFNDAGLEMAGFDQRGHGKNAGKKGHIENFDLFLKDLDSFVGMEKSDKPLFMLGHSLGGLIAARYVEEYPEKVKGVILSSGAFSSENVSNSLKILSCTFSVLFPTLTFNNGIDPKTLSRNDKVIEEYKKDPLVHDKITARFSCQLFKNIDLVFERVSKFTTPVLLTAGSEDHVVPPSGTKRLFSSIPAKDKEMKIFDGAYHEIFCDPQLSSEFRKKIVDWINKRV
uniref:Monoacylglycerol lipase n=1 Tax=Mesoaciditoga lauensis TaxID=1495039 RepID=A0A7V3VTC3_9BACT